MTAAGKAKALTSIVMRNTATYVALFNGCVIMGMAFIIGYEVWMRFVMNNPIPWSIEVPEQLLLVVVYLGLAYTTRVEGHVSMDIITIRLTPRVRGLLGAITSFVALGVNVFLLCQVALIFRDAFVEKWDLGATVRILVWPFYGFAVLGAFLMAVEWIGRIVVNWRQWRHHAR